jgi:DNA-directed RNA polymerase III subunit RPC6
MDLLLEINETKVVKDIVFTLKDTEQLLQKMEFDGYLERMRDPDGVLQMKEARWRTTKRVWRVEYQNESSQHFGPIEPEGRGWLPGNGLSQVPCARCPVKMKCTPRGVVNPEECKYLEEWMAF